jgi:hypothetical protein
VFAKTSRYADVPDAVFTDARGREIVYKKLRLVPSPPAIQVHEVGRGERLDRIAFRYFRDPEQFWRLCDANAALRPDDLTSELGRRLRVPLVR